MNYNELDLNLIKTFLCVYESKSILNASKKLFISQPAVTNSIKKLENYLGGQLFVRTPRGVVPTEEGKQFNTNCYNAMKQIENGVNNFTAYSTLQKGNLNIGSSSTIIRKLLMPFIAQFSKKYPNILISITDANSAKLISYTLRGDLDLVIMNTPIENESNFDVTELTTTIDCFISSINFEKDKLSKSELKNYPLILQKRPSNNRDYFDSLCVDNNVILQPKYEIGSFGLMTDFVSQNMGIAFIVKDFVKDDIKNKKVKEIKTDFKILPRKVVIINKQGSVNSFACKKFIEELIDYFKIFKNL